jgi:hypothetical protein
MTPEQSDALVSQIFHWTINPLDSLITRTLAISRVACIVCDTGSAWLKLPHADIDVANDVIGLHDSYHRLKPSFTLPEVSK